MFVSSVRLLSKEYVRLGDVKEIHTINYTEINKTVLIKINS